MEQHIITKAVFCQRVIDKVATVGHPVIFQLLRAENEDTFVSSLIVFYDCQGCKGFTKTNAICENTSIVLLQLVYNSKCSVPLEGI